MRLLSAKARHDARSAKAAHHEFRTKKGLHCFEDHRILDQMRDVVVKSDKIPEPDTALQKRVRTALIEMRSRFGHGVRRGDNPFVDPGDPCLFENILEDQRTDSVKQLFSRFAGIEALSRHHLHASPRLSRRRDISVST